MRLKKLIVFGFKSFADKTTFDFEQGITAIVGPNGCGKSNVVDAFRWVMGEASAKAIRGSKMPDVLFSGTQKRKSSPFAEVTLVFTDVKESLKVDYEEVAIARRLGRDGQSEYYLNKKPVRLKDLHELFSGTGIGKGSFWIFEQGKIDQVIQWSPQERRVIFEEAAGISGYLLKKKEALSRLKETQNNFEKIQERRGEQERLLEHLEKQAAEASKFHEKKEQLEKLEHSYYFTKADLLESKKEELECALAELSTEKLEEEKVAAESLYQERKLTLSRKHKGREEAKEALLSLQHQIDYLKRDVKRLYIAQESLGQREQSLLQEIEALHQNTDAEKNALIALKSDKETLSKEHEAKRLYVDKQRETILADEIELDTLNQTAKADEKEKFSVLQQKHHAVNQLKEWEYKREHQRKQTERLKTRSEQIEESLKAEDQKEKKLTVDFEETEKKYLKKVDQFQKLLEEIDALKEEKENKERHIITLTRKKAEVEAKQHSLLSLKRQNTKISKATKELYELNEDKKSPFYQKITPLCEVLKIPQELTSSLPHALPVKPEELLQQLVQINKESEQFWVTPEGLVCHTIEKKHHVIAREGEIHELEKELKILEKELQEHKASLESIDIKGLEHKKNLEDKEKQELKWSLRETKLLLEKIEQEREKLANEKVSIQNELNTLDLELEHTLEKELLENIEAKETLLSEMEKALATLHESIDEKRGAYQKRKELFLLQEKELSHLNQKMHEVTKNIALLEMKDKERENLDKRCHQELNECREKIKTTGENAHSNTLQLETLDSEFSTQAKKVDEIKADVESSEKLVLEEEQKLSSINQQIQSQKEKINQLKITFAEVDLKLTHIAQEVTDKYQIEINELSPSLMDLSLEQMEKKIFSLKKYMHNSDQINFAAISDYKKEKEISGDLENQLQDIENALHEIQAVIQELDKESRKLFKETFETIAGHFTDHFQKLFGGGTASLTLIEGEDLLESGIEIHVEPPGKNLRSIQLLSGGEKCLTAIALLLALFQVKPAPMCLLDEIDAPLDDVNVKRFLDMITPFSHKTQTIIITHNKLTMERADKLLGISMEEKGVTKMLSLSFAKASQTLELQHQK